MGTPRPRRDEPTRPWSRSWRRCTPRRSSLCGNQISGAPRHRGDVGLGQAHLDDRVRRIRRLLRLRRHDARRDHHGHEDDDVGSHVTLSPPGAAAETPIPVTASTSSLPPRRRRACTKGSTCLDGNPTYSVAPGTRQDSIFSVRNLRSKFRPMKTILLTRLSPFCHCVWAGPKSICSCTPWNTNFWSP